MVKVGIIGSGFGLYGLLPAFNTTPNCQVTPVCGEKTERLINYCQSIGLKKIYTDWRTMLDKEKLDAVAIAVPPDVQYQIAKVAINKDLHIFAEKPLAVTLKQTQELLRLAERRKIIHAVDFLFPEIEEWKKVKEIIDKKTLGKLRQINLKWDFLSYDIKNKISSWKTDVSAGGGALSFYFSHSLYYLEYFGGKILDIEGKLSYAKESINGGEVGVDLKIIFKNKVTGKAHLSCNNKYRNQHQLEFIFEKGIVSLENKDNSWVDFIIKIYQNDKLNQLSTPKKNMVKKDEDERVRVVKHLASRFINSIIQRKGMTPSFNDGVRVQELIEKIRKETFS